MLFLEKSIDKLKTVNKNIKSIMKEKLIIINIMNTEVYKKIEKSIQQNNNINNNLKNYINYTFAKNTKKNFFMCKSHKICLLTGKRSSVLKSFSFSRYKIKTLILQNKYTNLKKQNW